MTVATLIPRWISRLGHAAAAGWQTPGQIDEDTPLLDGPFLQQLERFALRVGRSGTTGFMGEHASRRKASSIEFADYRDYRPGDDFRLIDWNVYARLDQLTLRLTQATEATTLHLLLDCSGSMAWGTPSKRYAMQRIAASLGCIALARYDSVALVLLGGDAARCLPRLRGKNEIARLLSILDGIRPAGAVNLAAAVGSYCTVPRRGVGMLISDLLVPTGVEQAVGALRRSGLEPSVVQILAREERAPSIDGPVSLVDCENGTVVTASVTGDVVRAYTERFEAWSAELHGICSTQRVPFVQIQSDDRTEDLLAGALRGTVVR